MEQARLPEDHSADKMYRMYENRFIDKLTYFLTGVEPSLVRELPYEARAHRSIGLYIILMLVVMWLGLILFQNSSGLPFSSVLLVSFIILLYAMALRGYFAFINGRFYRGWVSFLLALPILFMTWLLFNPFLLFFLKDDFNEGKQTLMAEQVSQVQAVFEKDSLAAYTPADTTSQKGRAVRSIKFNISTLEPYQAQLADSIQYYDSVLTQANNRNVGVKNITDSSKAVQLSLNRNLARQDALYTSIGRVEDSINYYKKNLQSYDNKITVKLQRREKSSGMDTKLQDPLVYLQERKNTLGRNLAILTKEESRLKSVYASLQTQLKKAAGANRQVLWYSNRLQSFNDLNRETTSQLYLFKDTLAELTDESITTPRFDTLRQVRAAAVKKIVDKPFNLGLVYSIVKYQLENDEGFRKKYLLLIAIFLVPFIILLLYANLRKNIYRIIYTDYTHIQEQTSHRQAKSIIDIEKIKLNNIPLDRTLEALRAENLSDIRMADIGPASSPEDHYFNTAIKLEEIIKKTKYSPAYDQNYVEQALYNIDTAIAIAPARSNFWELKSRLHFLDENTTEGKNAADEFQRLRSEELFAANLSRSIVIDEMVFEGLKFYGSFSWKLNPSINILLGRNGYGKSHLLSIIAAVLQNDSTKSLELSLLNKPGAKGTVPNRHVKIYLETDHPMDDTLMKQKRAEIENLKRKVKERNLAENISKNDPETENLRAMIRQHTEALDIEEGLITLSPTALTSKFGKIPLLAIPDQRFVNKSSENTDSGVSDRLKGDEFLKNTAFHFITQLPYEAVLQNLLNILATSYFDNNRSFRSYFFTLISSTFEELTGNSFKWDDVKSNNDGSYRITVMTDGNEDPLPVQKISQGTFSVLSVFGLIYIFLKKKYSHITSDELILQQQAIVMIDELDAHLHPGWQQKLIGLLRRTFPNCQFIITAHSPLVVAGCKDEEVSVMREIRDDNNVNQGFFVEQIKEDFIGYTSDELYKRIFEIEGKDELYLTYTAMQPFEKQMTEEKQRLESLKATVKKLSPEEEKKLVKLYEDLYYLGKAKIKIEEKNSVSLLKSENIRLKADVEALTMKLRSVEPAT